MRSRFEWDFLGKYMCCLFVQGVIFFSLTLVIQSKFWKLSCSKSKVSAIKDQFEDIEDEDEDVKRERSRVLNSDVGTDVLQVKNLFKR